MSETNKDLIELATQSLMNMLAKRIENSSDDRLLKMILRDPESAYDYAGRLSYGKNGWNHRSVSFRWEPGEEVISTSAEFSFKYADNLLGERFPLGEPAISKDAEYSLQYAKDVVKGKWELGEEAISKDADAACEYACEVLVGRFPMGEPAISTSGSASYEYAVLIKERFIPGEEAISESPEMMYLYAKDVCGGRLPDHMHNKMVMLSFSDSGDFWVKKYTKAKKYMTKSRRRIAS